MPLTRPPDHETLTIFSLAFVMAALGALLKVLMDGVRRSAKQVLMKMFIMGLWGGVYGWAVTAKLTMTPEALSASAVIVGYAGYEATVSAIAKLLNPHFVQVLGLERREPVARTRKGDEGTRHD